MAITPPMQRKGNSIVDTNVSMSDAEHPTQKKSKYKLNIIFFLKINL